MKMIKNLDHVQSINPHQNVFYRGVVENNNDGGEGKVQVRILGIHTETSVRSGQNMGVPVDDLPWAEVMGPANVSGGVGTYGNTGIPLQGTWVWIFFDGGDWNKPIVSGIIYGTESSSPSGDQGFQDPDLIYPESDKIEQGTTRLAANRNVSNTGIIEIKDPERDVVNPMGIPNITWDEEKEQTTSVAYPNNECQAWTDGSFWEHDTTSGGRTHQFHNSGTYTETLPTGKHTLNIVDDQAVIVYKNSERLVKINETHTVQGESIYKIDLKQTILVGGESEETIMDNVMQIYLADQETSVFGNVTRFYDGTLTEIINGEVNETYSSGQITDGGPIIELKASIINLN